MKTYRHCCLLELLITCSIFVFLPAWTLPQSVTVLDKGSRYSTNICSSAVKASQRSRLALNPYGDANDDGILSLTDAALIKQHILGADLLDGDAVQRADANHNGKLDAGDMIYVMKNPSPAVIKDSTVVIDQLSTITVKSINLPEIIFNWPGTGILPFEEGDIIMGTVPVGYLRKIKTLEIFGTEIIVQTLDASLVEAVENGWFTAAMDLDGAKPDYESAPAPGSPRLMSATDGLYWDLAGVQLMQSSHFNLSMPEGSIRFDPNIDLSWDVGGKWTPPFAELKYFYFGADGNLQVDIDILMEATAGLSLNKSFDIPGLKASKRFAAGYVEGYAEAKVVGKVEVVGDVTTSVRTGFYSRVDVRFNVEYIRGGWRSGKHKYFEIYGKPVEVEMVKGGVTIRVTLAPVVSLIFYEVVGPTMSLEPYFKFRADAEVYPSLQIDAYLMTGFDILFGISFRIFDYTLFDYFFPAWHVWGPETLWSDTIVNSISINVTPDGGGWELTGPATYTGTGDRMGLNAIINPPPGDYTLTCQNNIAGYLPPPFSYTSKLTSHNSILFRPQWFTEENGMIVIDVSPNYGSWKLTGPAGFADVWGVGDRKNETAIFDVPPGEYTFTCINSIPKALPPLLPVTKELVSGGTISFDAVWMYNDILQMIPVLSDTFTMGRRDDGDDGILGGDDELPRHLVTLSDYEISRFEITNAEYCNVLNWALGNDYLQNASALPYDGGNVYMRWKLLLAVESPACQIEFDGNSFQCKLRDGHPMTDHPVTDVTWYGAVAFCNWLSEREGLTPAYGYSWFELLGRDKSGYRLPSEAEWERAAGWDADLQKHWIYGFMSDLPGGSDRCNYSQFNPLGLTSDPRTSPVGWFNGVNVSPNGNVSTVDSPSPVGCYDMSGNVREWVEDERFPNYSPCYQIDPIEHYGSYTRLYRGGSYKGNNIYIRTAARSETMLREAHNDETGFRVARTTGLSVTPTPTPTPSPTPNINHYDMINIDAGTFTMGRRDDGDDETLGAADELPRHEVTLPAYQIGKYEVTNQQYCHVLNWALAEGLLEDGTGAAYTGGDIYKGGVLLLNMENDDPICEYPSCQIEFTGDAFTWRFQTGHGDECGIGRGDFPMNDHPVVRVTWYGAVTYCNWLSEIEGAPPAYDLATWELSNAAGGGYRLPSEAEWERAAAWDGSKHWIYGFTSDTLDSVSDSVRCNFAWINPFNFWFQSGCYDTPFTTPAGWFDGQNISPGNQTQTVDSPSPAGCYDMSGNVDEWCHDWYGETYYTSDPVVNPLGPATGATRVVRGGNLYSWNDQCRTAKRAHVSPNAGIGTRGFRVARDE